VESSAGPPSGNCSPTGTRSDLSAPREQLCPFTRVDLTDSGQTVEACTAIDGRYAGVNAVVHLAAIPGPMSPNAGRTRLITYRANCSETNVPDGQDSVRPGTVP
jgi:hypothetical protein